MDPEPGQEVRLVAADWSDLRSAELEEMCLQPVFIWASFLFDSLTGATFDVLRSVVFFYIKTPLRVKEAGLEELIPTTWWPTHFDKEVKPTQLLLT